MTAPDLTTTGSYPCRDPRKTYNNYIYRLAHLTQFLTHLDPTVLRYRLSPSFNQCLGYRIEQYGVRGARYRYLAHYRPLLASTEVRQRCCVLCDEIMPREKPCLLFFWFAIWHYDEIRQVRLGFEALVECNLKVSRNILKHFNICI